MVACAAPLPDAPLLRLKLAGRGEPLLRMEKRLSCAAAGAGLKLELEIRKDYEALGIAPSDTPAVLCDGQVVFNGVPRTEEIEAWLKQKICMPTALSGDRQRNR